VPFPSNFHWTSKIQRPFLWENTNRTILSSFVGSQDSYWLYAKSMRRWLLGHCIRSPADCTHTTYGKGNTRESSIIGGSMNDPHALVSLNSVFCFQPLGDMPTRKGLFDSLAYGCIPVIFDVLTGPSMYVWHWPEDLWKKIVVEIEYVRYSTLNPIHFLADLLKYNRSLILEKQKLIREHVFELQYALEDSSQYDTWPKDVNGRLLKDAYARSMDLVLGWHGGNLSRVRDASIPACWGGARVVNNKCVS
jgi:hypothetical protein